MWMVLKNMKRKLKDNNRNKEGWQLGCEKWLLEMPKKVYGFILY